MAFVEKIWIFHRKALIIDGFCGKNMDFLFIINHCVQELLFHWLPWHIEIKFSHNLSCHSFWNDCSRQRNHQIWNNISFVLLFLFSSLFIFSLFVWMAYTSEFNNNYIYTVKKLNFPLRISALNTTKSAVSCVQCYRF